MSNNRYGQGYLIYAFGKEYIEMAVELSRSIQRTQTHKLAALVYDEDTPPSLEDARWFEHLIPINRKDAPPMACEWQAFALSPFKETIKLDADMIIHESIDHWWPIMRQQEVCFTTNVRTYQNNMVTSRAHRKLFDDNDLPNIYTALYYFRYSMTATKLFRFAHEITMNWNDVARTLKGNTDLSIRTDEVFAIAAQLVGLDKCTLPGLTVPTFVHMKEEINGLSNTKPWPEQLYCENYMRMIDSNSQYYPVHYGHRNFEALDVKK